MQAYNDNNEIVASNIPPLQGVALQYKPTLDNLLSFVHNQECTHKKTYTKGETNPPAYPTVHESEGLRCH